MKNVNDKVTPDVLTEVAYTYDLFAKDCYLFNELTGQANKTSLSDLNNQIELIQEELTETEVALEDSVELLDGCIDVLVTAIGLAQKLENIGFDVKTAMKRVAKNNLTKLVAVEYKAHDTLFYYTDRGIPCYITQHESGVYAVKRKSDDKLMKPVGYKSVDLSDLV